MVAVKATELSSPLPWANSYTDNNYSCTTESWINSICTTNKRKRPNREGWGGTGATGILWSAGASEDHFLFPPISIRWGWVGALFLGSDLPARSPPQLFLVTLPWAFCLGNNGIKQEKKGVTKTKTIKPTLGVGGGTRGATGEDGAGPWDWNMGATCAPSHVPPGCRSEVGALRAWPAAVQAFTKPCWGVTEHMPCGRPAWVQRACSCCRCPASPTEDAVGAA